MADPEILHSIIERLEAENAELKRRIDRYEKEAERRELAILQKPDRHAWMAM